MPHMARVRRDVAALAATVLVDCYLQQIVQTGPVGGHPLATSNGIITVSDRADQGERPRAAVICAGVSLTGAPSFAHPNE
jgi:hypothetical protein